MDIFALRDCVRETAFAIHRYLRHGHFEKVYENALVHRPTKQGLQVSPQVAMCVRDEDGTELGRYVADLVIAGEIIVEVKATKALGSADIVQVLGYLRASGLRHGLLVNFGGPRLEIKKLVL